MNKWHNRMMRLAREVASWSKDTTKVGAVITDNHNRIVSVGYNGPPRMVVDDSTIDRQTKLRRTIHAEENAILFARRDLSGHTLYCTHHPCGPCAAVIIQVGITHVVIPHDESPFMHRWAADIMESASMFDEAGIIVETLTDEC